jgi:transcription elongation factor GreA
MKKDTIYLTQQGFDDVQHELEELKGQRPKVLKDMDHMRALGDLKENSAYEEKRRELGFVEGRISELEELMKNAQVITPVASDVVSLGSVVELHIEGDHVRYQIVDENEASVLDGKISMVSPIGEALLGRKVGDTVQIESPGGKITYQIMSID